MPEIVPSVACGLGSWALTVAAKAKSTRLRKMTEGLFGGRASKKLSPVPRFLALDSLHRISTCSALLRCVLGGLGGCGSQSLGTGKPIPYLVRVAFWFGFAPSLSKFNRRVRGPARIRALHVPEPSLLSPFSLQHRKELHSKDPWVSRRCYLLSYQGLRTILVFLRI